MRVFVIIAAIILGLVILWNTTAYRDVDELKNNGVDFLEERGFIVTSYDGYEGSLFHGGFTWYKANDEDGYLYEMALGEWRGEIMLYNVTCLNAVKNSE